MLPTSKDAEDQVVKCLGDSCCAGISTFCHRVTDFLDGLEVSLGEKSIIRGAAI